MKILISFSYYVIIILILLPLVTCEYCPERYSENDEKPWTIMFYIDEDFVLTFSRFEHIKQKIKSNDNINIILLEDQRLSTPNYWYINENSEAILLKEFDELNMGDPQTLSDFIEYSQRSFPAQRYFLNIYNHGGGWLGACWDESHDFDWLTPSEMEIALKKNDKMDMIMMIACSMSAIETIYQFRDCFKVYIGSENSAQYHMFGEPLYEIMELVSESENITNIDLGNDIVDCIWNSTEQSQIFSNDDKTISVFRSKYLDRLINDFDELCIYYLGNFSDFKYFMDEIIYNIEYYRNLRIDFVDLLELINNLESNNNAKLKIEKVLRSYEKVLINEKHGESVNFSNGISIYLPIPTVETYNYFYSSDDLNSSFVKDTHWDELIERYFEDRGLLRVNKIPKMPDLLEE